MAFRLGNCKRQLAFAPTIRRGDLAAKLRWQPAPPVRSPLSASRVDETLNRIPRKKRPVHRCCAARHQGQNAGRRRGRGRQTRARPRSHPLSPSSRLLAAAPRPSSPPTSAPVPPPRPMVGPDIRRRRAPPIPMSSADGRPHLSSWVTVSVSNSQGLGPGRLSRACAVKHIQSYLINSSFRPLQPPRRTGTPHSDPCWHRSRAPASPLQDV